MDENILELQTEVEGLKKWKVSLENSSTIPLAIDQAFRKRFGRTLYGSKTHNFGNIASYASETTTLVVVGAELGDPVSIGLPTGALNADGIKFAAWVSDKDTVTLQAHNTEDVSLNPGEGTFRVAVHKQ